MLKADQLKVLRVIASVDPRAGGPGEALRHSVQLFRDLGHHSEILTLDNPASGYLADFPAIVHPMGSGLGKYRYTPRLARWIADNAHRFEIAVIHGLWNHASIGGWKGARKGGLPYVLFVHGMMDPWFKKEYPLKHLAKQAFWWLWQGKVLRDAKAVLFTSEEERALAKGVFRGPGYLERVVAYGAGDVPVESPAEARAFLQKVPKLLQQPYLLFLGRIHPKKGCDLLVHAFAAISDRASDLHLVMAGPDQIGHKRELMSMAEQLGIAERVHWPGMLTGDAKFGALRNAEAMVLPSHQENFGVVVAEALACKCPVLISNRVNIFREVSESRAGLVEDDSLAGTISLLEKFLQLSIYDKDQMGEAGYRLYRDRFTALAAAQDLQSVLLQALSGSAGRP